MNQLTTLAGTVSGLRVDTTTTVDTTVNTTNSGIPGTTMSTSSSTKTTVNFRIDNRPAYMNVAVNLTNGDVITAAGIQKGEFETIAFHNHTTNTIYSIPGPANPIIIGIVGFIIFILVSWIPFLNIITFAMAIYYLLDATKKKKQINEAWDLVKKASPPQGK